MNRGRTGQEGGAGQQGHIFCNEKRKSVGKERRAVSVHSVLWDKAKAQRLRGRDLNVLDKPKSNSCQCNRQSGIVENVASHPKCSPTFSPQETSVSPSHPD